jgi:CubicO group peptidase (beta-lactamase class C family)
MKKNFLLLIFTIVSTIVFAQTKEENIDKLLTAYQSGNEFNGTALVSYNGKVLINKGYGFKNIAESNPATNETIFQIGSITKQFTATLILRLEEKGKLKTTDYISKYFPDFPRGNEITIHHLLTHTSGIFNYTNDASFMATEAVKPISEDKMLALFKNIKLDFEPGSKWSYSNSGYILLGYIIQKVTKKSYEQEIRDCIFKPLKMSQSGFDFVALKSPNKAQGYFAIDGEKSVIAPVVDSSVSFSAGSIYTTTADLQKWHEGLFNNKIIKRESLEKAFTKYQSNYGYGWFMSENGGKKYQSHGGGIFGFNAAFTRSEADNSAVILLNNMGNPKLDEISKSIINILNDKPFTLPNIKKEIKLSEEILRKYIGTYEIVPHFKIDITVENGELIAQATGQPKFTLYAQKENYFFVKAVEAEVEFAVNEKNEIEKLILYQGGKTMLGKKIK